MLANSFRTCEELQITEEQRQALIKTLSMFELGKIKHILEWEETYGEKEFSGHFNMRAWTRPIECGTVACIGGTAQLLTGVSFAGYAVHPKLCYLFAPNVPFWEKITPEMASTALRNFLTTGNPDWENVCDR